MNYTDIIIYMSRQKVQSGIFSNSTSRNSKFSLAPVELSTGRELGSVHSFTQTTHIRGCPFEVIRMRSISRKQIMYRSGWAISRPSSSPFVLGTRFDLLQVFGTCIHQ